MKKFLNRRNALLGFGAIVLLIVASYQSASIRGRWVARYDLARGHYRVLAYGLAPSTVNEYRQILQERYGVEYRQVASCIVSHSLMSYVDAYDEVSGAAIRSKFGPNVFKESWDDAANRWKEGHKAELKKISHSE